MIISKDLRIQVLMDYITENQMESPYLTIQLRFEPIEDIQWTLMRKTRVNWSYVEKRDSTVTEYLVIARKGGSWISHAPLYIIREKMVSK